MRSRRILFISDHPSLNSGYGIIASHIAQHLWERGHEIKFIGWWATQNLKEQPYEVIPIFDPIDKFGIKLFPKIVESFRPDIVWTTGDMWMIYHITRLRGRNSYKSIWYAPIDSKGSPRTMKSEAELIDWAQVTMSFDYAIGQSNFCKNELNELCQKDIVKDVIYPGYDENIFKPLDKTSVADLKKRFTKTDDGLLYLYVSRNGFRKNPCGAIEAFTKANIPNAKLYMHCNKHELRGYDLEESVRRNNAKDKVILSDLTIGTGIAPAALNKLYNAADVFLLISTREGFGIPYLEAAATGLPVIYTNENAPKEYCKYFGEPVRPITYYPDAITGSLAAIPDISEATYKIKTMAKSPQLRNKLSIAGIEFAKDHTWTKTLAWWSDLIENKIDISTNQKFINQQLQEESHFKSFKVNPERKVAFMTTWNEGCGIAKYSKDLTDCIFPDPLILAPDTSGGQMNACQVIKCWTRTNCNYQNIYKAIIDNEISVLHVQHEWAFTWMNSAAFRAFIASLAKNGVRILITFHTTPNVLNAYTSKIADEISILTRYARPIFHTRFAADIMEMHSSFVASPIIMPHGCKYFESDKPKNEIFTLVSSGFAHPSKGAEICIEASKLLQIPHNLIIHSSVHPLDKGTQQKYLDSLRKKADGFGQIEIIDKFLTDNELGELFSKSHLGLFMYQTMPSQGVSGAAATCIGNGIPIIVSNCPAFHNLRAFPHSNFNPETLAKIIENISRDINLQKSLSELASNFRENLRWENLAIKYIELYMA